MTRDECRPSHQRGRSPGPTPARGRRDMIAGPRAR